MNIYEQGDLIWINFNPTVGHEPQKKRPAVVVSCGYFNNVLSSLTVVCPITSTVNGHPLHIQIEQTPEVEGCICLEQLRAVDLEHPSRSVEKTGVKLDGKTMTRVLDGLGAIFDI